MSTQAQRMAFKALFWRLRQIAMSRFDYLPNLKLAPCFVADQEHAASPRQHCHWGHVKNTICYDASTLSLPEANQIGLLAHELGHALDDLFEPEPDTEEEVQADDFDSIKDHEARADVIALALLGIEISYDDNDVQTVAHAESRDAPPRRSRERAS